MSRTIELSYNGANVKCSLEKVDRSTLYGSVDVETRDSEGRACRLVTLASDGRTLVPSGNTALAYVDRDGQWLERSSLVPRDLAGNRLNSVASSFSAPIVLETKTSAQRFLDHSIRLAYALAPVEGAMPDALSKALAKGDIFKTDFSYRGGVGVDPAFVMQGADGTVWFLVGDENDINFVGFNQSGVLGDGEEADASDDIDFDMM